MTRTLASNWRHHPRYRYGFTLVELLVAVTIMAILASATLFATFSAREAARVAKTQATISKLNALIMSKWDGYHTRRVPVTIVAGSPRNAAAAVRLRGLQQLMRLELPQRWVEVTTEPDRVPRTALSKAYKRYYDSINPSAQFENAECLYMIVAIGMADQAALDRFDESEIGDVDGDGAKEFIDAWGTPIRFLRAAPSFPSDLQSDDPVTHPDPFDPLRIDTESFAIYPVIYSAGPDQIFDIFSGNSNEVTDDPYDTMDALRTGEPRDLPSFAKGEANGSLDHYDNIHNHRLSGQIR